LDKALTGFVPFLWSRLSAQGSEYLVLHNKIKTTTTNASPRARRRGLNNELQVGGNNRSVLINRDSSSKRLTPFSLLSNHQWLNCSNTPIRAHTQTDSVYKKNYVSLLRPFTEPRMKKDI
jgi:hypothetical protein